MKMIKLLKQIHLKLIVFLFIIPVHVFSGVHENSAEIKEEDYFVSPSINILQKFNEADIGNSFSFATSFYFKDKRSGDNEFHQFDFMIKLKKTSLGGLVIYDPRVRSSEKLNFKGFSVIINDVAIQDSGSFNHLNTVTLSKDEVRASAQSKYNLPPVISDDSVEVFDLENLSKLEIKMKVKIPTIAE